uniref:SH3 domain-containing protein n=1 Tax=Pseudonaja textilis TaxID=8673 RepID=A0A670XY89_PSETE
MRLIRTLYLNFPSPCLFSLQNLMARALYDNVPECAEELAFRKGDILTVIEQNTEGLEGWWLCSLHGRQGIVPGNRVKLLVGPVQESPSHQDLPNSGPATQSPNQQKVYQVPNAHTSPRDPIYQVPPSYLNQGIYQVPTAHDIKVPICLKNLSFRLHGKNDARVALLLCQE